MTEGQLGARKLKKIHTITGINAIAGWAWHPCWEFRDDDDHHYLLHTRLWIWHRVDYPAHYASCPAY